MSTLVYFLIWGGFFFEMMRFGCGAHIMGYTKNHRHGDENQNAPKTVCQWRRQIVPGGGVKVYQSG